jgi:hypothetical protein
VPRRLKLRLQCRRPRLRRQQRLHLPRGFCHLGSQVSTQARHVAVALPHLGLAAESKSASTGLVVR